MDWDTALEHLGRGDDVYRQMWDTDTVVSPEFATLEETQNNLDAWPYGNTERGAFRLRIWPEGDVYEPADEDKKATDWELG